MTSQARERKRDEGKETKVKKETGKEEKVKRQRLKKRQRWQVRRGERGNKKRKR